MTEKSGALSGLVESSDSDFDPNTILQVFAERLRERDKPVDLSISQATLNANSSVKRPLPASTLRPAEQAGNGTVDSARPRFRAPAGRWDMSDVSDAEDISERRPALAAPWLVQPTVAAQDWVIEDAVVAIEQGQEQGQEQEPRQAVPVSADEDVPPQTLAQVAEVLEPQLAEPLLHSEFAQNVETAAAAVHAGAQEAEARRAAHQRMLAEREQAAQQAMATRARAKALKLEKLQEERKAKQAALAQARVAKQSKLAVQAELAKEKQKLLTAKGAAAKREATERRAAQEAAAQEAAEREAVQRDAAAREAAEQEAEAREAAAALAAALAAQTVEAAEAARLAEAVKAAQAAEAAKAAELALREAQALAQRQAQAAERARLQAEAAAPFLRIDMPKLAPQAAKKTDAPDLDLSGLGLSRLARQSSPAAAPELDLSGLAARAQPQAKPAPDLQDFRALLTQVSQQATMLNQPHEAPTSAGPGADWQASDALRDALQAQRQPLEAQSPLDLASLNAISALARKGSGGSRAS